MNSIFRRCLCALLLRVMLGSLVASWAADARAAGYTFTNIVDSTAAAPSGTFTSFGIPSISGDNVAFHATYNGGTGIFEGNGGPVTTIVKSGDAAPSGTFSRFDGPTISGNTAAFLGQYAGGHQLLGIFTGSGGALTSIADMGDNVTPGTFNGFADFPVISGGNVAFIGRPVGENVGIYMTNGGAYAFIGAGRNPSISGNNVAFQSFVNGFSEIFVASGGVLSSLSPGEFPSISGDAVAFLGGESGAGITLIRGGVPTTIVRAGDPAPIGNFLGWGPPATDGTNVGFLGGYGDLQLLEHQGTGIFVGSGGPLTTVIKTGEPLLGNTVVGLTGPGFENWFGLDPSGTGNVAFGYLLADGRRGIAMAHPVPEPASVVLTFLAVIGFAPFAGSSRCGN